MDIFVHILLRNCQVQSTTINHQHDKKRLNRFQDRFHNLLQTFSFIFVLWSCKSNREGKLKLKHFEMDLMAQEQHIYVSK